MTLTPEMFTSCEHALCLLPLLTCFSLPGIPLPMSRIMNPLPLVQPLQRAELGQVQRLIPPPSKLTLFTRAAQQWIDLCQLYSGPRKSSTSRKWDQFRSAFSCGLFCPIKSPSALGLYFRGSFTAYQSSCYLSPSSFFRSISSPWHMSWSACP